MDSILTSIKKLLDIEEECTQFDTDIILHINTVLVILNQLGVGPDEGLMIEDKMSIWDDLISPTDKLSFVKTYMFLKVKLVFDPPASAAAVEGMKASALEYEWRIAVQVDLNKTLV